MNNDLAAIQQDQAAVAADIQALVNPTPAPSKSCRTVLFDAAKRIAAYRQGVAALDKKYNLGGQLWAIHVAAIAGLAQVGHVERSGHRGRAVRQRRGRPRRGHDQLAGAVE